MSERAPEQLAVGICGGRASDSDGGQDLANVKHYLAKVPGVRLLVSAGKRRSRRRLSPEKFVAAVQASLPDRPPRRHAPIAETTKAESAAGLTSDRIATAAEGQAALTAVAAWMGQGVRLLAYGLRRAPDEMVMLIVHPDAEVVKVLQGEQLDAIRAAILRKRVSRCFVRVLDQDGRLTPLIDISAFCREGIAGTEIRWLSGRFDQHSPDAKFCRDPAQYFRILEWLAAQPGLLDFAARGVLAARNITQVPFDKPSELPPMVPAAPQRRSALFLYTNYYHFKHLAAALRARGWDALAVSFDAPDSPNRQFSHGEDLTIYDRDPDALVELKRKFLAQAPERFGSVHFYGQGVPTLFPQYGEHTAVPENLPWDFLELRRHNVLIGYMPSGCLDGGTQTSIRRQARNVCGRCIWELRPDVCADAISLAWARKLASICDVVTLEGDHAVDDRIGPKYVRGPVVTALSPDHWTLDLEIPDDRRIVRKRGEVLIYHAFGNAATRKLEGRDIKGTGAVVDAVERLRAEGVPVRLFFAEHIPSIDVRYYQAQADIIVDQLNYGRFGANAREAMMLGKPLVTRLIPDQGPHLPPYRPLLESPAVDASEDTIYDVLRALVPDRQRRRAMGKASRAYAMKWHSAPRCAERYERMIDRLRAGLPPETDELFA